MRVHLADILLQANANEYIRIDSGPLRVYIRSLLSSDDKNVAIAATSALGVSSATEDVQALAVALRDPRDGVFRAAVLSLAFLCNGEATDALTSYAAEATHEDRRRFLDETVERAKAHRQTNGACSQR